MEALRSSLRDAKDLVKGEVHLVMKEEAKSVTKMLALELRHQLSHALCVQRGERLCVEERLDEAKLVDDVGYVLSAPSVALEERIQARPLAPCSLPDRITRQLLPLVGVAAARQL
eukprot:5468177-Pleurochrysis_carterae.AAC.2